MLKSGSGGAKGSQTISVGDFQQKEDLQMYGEIPDYDAFHGRDLAIDTDLSHIDERIYANFHKPSWNASKQHSFTAGTPKKLFPDLEIMDGVVERTSSRKKDRMCGLVEKSQYRIRLANW